MDVQRGGWYDVVDRTLGPGEKYHRYAWHDRKAWWQQEQAILAYLILNGCLHDPQYGKLARESASFYNAWFLDSDNGGVYFNVLANGIPYLLGTERLKGSHSMSLYHSTELCYLSAVYSNLLITGQPLDLHFKPKPGAWKDNILRVSPDILPPGSIRLDAVWIDGQQYSEFDAEKLEVKLPHSDRDLRVRVRVVPTQRTEGFYTSLATVGDVAKVTMSGKLAPASAHAFKAEVDRAISQNPKKLVLMMNDLDEISPQGVRVIVFATEHLNVDAQIYGIGASDAVRNAFKELEFDEDIVWMGDYDAAAIEKS
jgi:anti-anti-sigma factor